MTYEPVAGDVQIVARVTGMTGASNGRGGVMIRADLTPGSPQADLLQYGGTSPHSVFLYQRIEDAPAASAIYGSNQPTSAIPYWLKVVRHGDIVNAYESPDGVNWTFDNRQTLNVPVGSTLDVGLAVDSYGSTSPATTVTFDHVSISYPATTQETSWLGNTYGGGDTHVQNGTKSIYVDPAGKDVLVTGSDEDKDLAIYDGGGDFINFGSTTHYQGGNSVTSDGSTVFESMLAHYTNPKDGQFTGVQAYSLDGYPITSNVLNLGLDGNGNVVQDNIAGLAVANGDLYVGDATTGLVTVHPTGNIGQSTGVSWAVPNMGNMAADPQGNLWIVENANGSTPAEVAHYSPSGTLLGSITFPAATFSHTVVPRGIAVDFRSGPTNGQVYVTDVGWLQQVDVFNPNGSFVKAIGAQHGIYGGSDPGSDGPLRFNYPVGLGIDGSGNLYVANNGAFGQWAGGGALGGSLQKYDASDNLLWRRQSASYVDTADLDPLSTSNAYTGFAHFTLNYDTYTAGSEWSYAGTTIDPFAHPDDPRLLNSPHSGIAGTPPVSDGTKYSGESPRAGTEVRYIDGQKFLFDFDQHGSAVNIYRFLPNSEITVFAAELQAETDRYSKPQGMLFNNGFYIWTDQDGDGTKQASEEAFTNEPLFYNYGWYVDAIGDIWTADKIAGIREYKPEGINPVGAPIYKDADKLTWAIPSQFTELTRALYDVSKDTMYLAGYTTAHPRSSTDTGFGAVGTELFAYHNWSTNGINQSFAWETVLPYSGSAGGTSAPANDLDLKALAFAGNYVFAQSVFGPTGIRVFDRNTGVLVTTLPSGPEVGNNALTDFPNALTATRLADGEYVLLAEEDSEAKVLMYRWTPGQTHPVSGWISQDVGTPAQAGSASFDPVSVTWTVTGGGNDIWNTSDNFHLAATYFLGGGSLVARVTSLTNANVWAKAGVMFRDSTAANASYADVVATPGEGVAFQWRSTDGGSPGNAQVVGLSAPDWVKLTRSGNSFSGYYSTDGQTWHQIGTAEKVSMASAAQAGLAVTAHNNAALATATFADVSFSNGSAPQFEVPPAPIPTLPTVGDPGAIPSGPRPPRSVPGLPAIASMVANRPPKVVPQRSGSSS